MIVIYYWYYDNYYQAFYAECEYERAIRFMFMLFNNNKYRFDSYVCDSMEINDILNKRLRLMRKKYGK